MPFHVEIASGMRHARVFNLEPGDLDAAVIRPWLEDRMIAMGDQEWQPRESELRILEGPRMENPDLAFGQGWSNAERASRDVTRETLAAAPAPRSPDAYAIAAAEPEALAAELAAAHGGESLRWAEARQRLERGDGEVAAVILVLRAPGTDPRS